MTLTTPCYKVETKNDLMRHTEHPFQTKNYMRLLCLLNNNGEAYGEALKHREGKRVSFWVFWLNVARSQIQKPRLSCWYYVKQAC